MTITALKEAAQIGVPRDKIVGPHPTCVEQDMVPAGEAAIGFICASVHGTGRDFPLIQDILTYVYARGKGPGPASDVGTGHWIRGLVRALLTPEALHTAMRHFGHQPLTGAQVQWGFEHLSLTAASLKELGAEGLLPPLTLSCRDHEGAGASSSSSGTANSGPRSPTGWRRIRRWCGPWWRRRQRSMRRRRGSRRGTVRRRVVPVGWREVRHGRSEEQSPGAGHPAPLTTASRRRPAASAARPLSGAPDAQR